MLFPSSDLWTGMSRLLWAQWAHVGSWQLVLGLPDAVTRDGAGVTFEFLNPVAAAPLERL